MEGGSEESVWVELGTKRTREERGGGLALIGIAHHLNIRIY